MPYTAVWWIIPALPNHLSRPQICSGCRTYCTQATARNFQRPFSRLGHNHRLRGATSARPQGQGDRTGGGKSCTAVGKTLLRHRHEPQGSQPNRGASGQGPCAALWARTGRGKRRGSSGDEIARKNSRASPSMVASKRLLASRPLPLSTEGGVLIDGGTMASPGSGTANSRTPAPPAGRTGRRAPQGHRALRRGRPWCPASRLRPSPWW